MTHDTDRPTVPATEQAESVTSDERRRWLEELAFAPDPEKRELDPMTLGSVGALAIDPVGERFIGEGEALASIVATRSYGHPFETRILALAALEVWATAHQGTLASRTALLRAASAFLLHDAATSGALAARDVQGTGPSSREP